MLWSSPELLIIEGICKTTLFLFLSVLSRHFLLPLPLSPRPVAQKHRWRTGCQAKSTGLDASNIRPYALSLYNDY